MNRFRRCDIEGIVSFDLEDGANPATQEELERWKLEGRDDAGEFETVTKL